MIKSIIKSYMGWPSGLRLALLILYLIATIGGFVSISTEKQPFGLRPDSLSIITIIGLIFFIIEIVLESFLIARNDIVNLIEGTKYRENEPDIIKRILEMKLGNQVTALVQFDNLPVTLVPGGDIAMVMTQEEYKTLLQKLLDIAWREIKWTTFTPFEAFNQGLSINIDTDKEKWNHRLEDKNGYLNYTFSNNRNYYDLTSKWYRHRASTKRQFIILSKEQSHPLYYKKYFNKYPYCIDFSKYLVARYNKMDIAAFERAQEMTFMNYIESALEADIYDLELTKWLYIEDISPDLLNKIHHLDFVIFKSDSPFVLVRVDPANYLRRTGGLIGITFLIYVECNIRYYENIIDNFNTVAKNSFIDLINACSPFTKDSVVNALKGALHI